MSRIQVRLQNIKGEEIHQTTIPPLQFAPECMILAGRVYTYFEAVGDTDDYFLIYREATTYLLSGNTACHVSGIQSAIVKHPHIRATKHAESV